LNSTCHIHVKEIDLNRVTGIYVLLPDKIMFVQEVYLNNGHINKQEQSERSNFN